MERYAASEQVESRRDRALLQTLVYGVLRWRGRLDYIIAHFSRTRFDKINPKVLNILRLAIFELLYRADIPAKVSINEAVDLGKKYGSEDSGAFINGILDRIRVDLEEGTLKVPAAPEQRLGDPTQRRVDSKEAAGSEQ